MYQSRPSCAMHALRWCHSGAHRSWYYTVTIALTMPPALQVLFAILLAALGIAQAQMSFPDITQAAVAIERVFGTIDRSPSIDISDDKGDLTICLAFPWPHVS